uniref:Uncharacterized protein n=1 Tax=Aegilops tauschii TaxID=37682 RepID=R7WGJ2_AEGTA
MAKTLLLLLLCATIAARAHAQAPARPAEEETPPGAGVKVSFRPSVAIVVGIFTMIFSLTFLLLIWSLINGCLELELELDMNNNAFMHQILLDR